MTYLLGRYWVADGTQKHKLLETSKRIEIGELIEAVFCENEGL